MKKYLILLSIAFLGIGLQKATAQEENSRKIVEKKIDNSGYLGQVTVISEDPLGNRHDESIKATVVYSYLPFFSGVIFTALFTALYFLACMIKKQKAILAAYFAFAIFFSLVGFTFIFLITSFWSKQPDFSFDELFGGLDKTIGFSMIVNCITAAALLGIFKVTVTTSNFLPRNKIVT